MISLTEYKKVLDATYIKYVIHNYAIVLVFNCVKLHSHCHRLCLH